MFIYDFFKKCFDRGPQCGLYGVIHKQSYRLQFTFLEEFLSWCWTTKCALECREYLRNTLELWEMLWEEREGERSNLIRFYGSTCSLLEQLVSTWSGLVYFTHLYQMFSNKCHGKRKKEIFYQRFKRSPYNWKICSFLRFLSKRLDQSGNIIERFESASESYTKKLKLNWEMKWRFSSWSIV